MGAKLSSKCSCCKGNCKGNPRHPPYEPDLESQAKWKSIDGAFSSRPMVKKLKGNNKSALSKKYSHIAVRRDEVKRMTSGESTNIDLMFTNSGARYATLERTFHPIESERNLLANITNPRVTFKLRCRDFTGAIDESVHIDFARINNKKKEWHAAKIHTDLYVNGIKQSGWLVERRTNAFLQLLSKESDGVVERVVGKNKNKSKSKSKSKSKEENKNSDDVIMTLVTYKGPIFHRPKKGYKRGRIFHLFRGHINGRDYVHEDGTVENAAAVAFRENRLVAVLNEQNQTMHVCKRSVASDPDLTPNVEGPISDLQSVVRCGTAFMLLQKLGLESFRDV